MAENDIYNSKGRYEKFKQGIRDLIIPVEINNKKGKRHYYVKNKENLQYFEKLIDKFEAKDISFVRRLRLLNQLKIICFATNKNLKDCGRDDIDSIMRFMHTRYNSPKSKFDFIIDIKFIWKQILPERDERGQIDNTIVPYPVRHLKPHQDKSREKARKDRLTPSDFERLVSYFSRKPKMQAYLTLALESLGRPQELLYLRIKDVEFADNYAKIRLSEHGKEGIGILQCIDSYPYVLKWYNAHPLNKDAEAFLFISDRDKNQLTPYAINNQIKDACKVLNIKKPVTCYSLKRNGVTFRRLAGEGDLEIQHAARWTSTKQLSTYDMSDQEDAFKLALIRKGIIKPTKEDKKAVMKVKICVFCNEKVGFSEEICPFCKHILDRTKIKQQIESTGILEQQLRELRELQKLQEDRLKFIYDQMLKQTN